MSCATAHDEDAGSEGCRRQEAESRRGVAGRRRQEGAREKDGELESRKPLDSNARESESKSDSERAKSHSLGAAGTRSGPERVHI